MNKPEKINEFKAKVILTEAYNKITLELGVDIEINLKEYFEFEEVESTDKVIMPPINYLGIYTFKQRAYVKD